MIGFDDGDNPINVEGTEGLLHHGSSGLGGQTASPSVGV
jgi:hypothetical protein